MPNEHGNPTPEESLDNLLELANTVEEYTQEDISYFKERLAEVYAEFVFHIKMKGVGKCDQTCTKR